MTDREKIAHLLRRFGFGGSKWELDQYAALGLPGAIDRLIDYDKVEEGFPVSPWSFCFEEGKTEVYLDPFRIGAWWALRMLMSQRPLEQKLTLFWHNHFAVGGDKVEFGPAMLAYVETLRKNATGDFLPLLRAVSSEPAMLKYLDGDTNQLGHPNENFAREVMELFTLGQGHYTETDVKEAARAFTGWGIRYLLFEQGGDKVQETAKASIASGTPMIAFCITPSLHDEGTKTVLGETGAFNGNQILEQLAARPETARRITSKMWKFFVSEDAPSKVVDRLAAKFTETHGNTRAVLREMVACEEFWQTRTIVKSPIDFVVGTLRSLNVHEILTTLFGKPATPNGPATKPMRDVAGLLAGTLYAQGMMPLYPPNVSGWDGGTAWITAANMLQRAKFADTIMGVGQADQGIAAYLGQQVMAAKPADSDAAVRAVLGVFDADLPDAKVKLLANTFEKHGGIASLATGKSASVSLSAVLRPLFGTPEYQHC